MPYINGIETIRMLKNKLKIDIKKQPVILLHSSLDNLQLEKECLELGIRFRLSKPVKRNDLFNYLNNINQEKASSLEKEIFEATKMDNIHKDVKILIAEDVFLNMVLIKAILSELGFNNEIIEAKNGIEAIEQYQKMGPDLILMDVHMPELDGISATKKIREIELLSGNKTPIIALTAGALKEEKEKCFANGMNDFLTKPIAPDKIMAMLNKYLIKGTYSHELFHTIESEIDLHMAYHELANVLNSKSIIKKVMTLALKDIPAQILELEEACSEKHPERVSAAAHRIKGSSSYMRFSIMAKIAEKIENELKNDNCGKNLELQLSELKAEWDIVKKIMQQKLN
jgi:CheY-like chemotaxis protein/HPt (histidine-containing phosphotransfer) domain-containing protein